MDIKQEEWEARLGSGLSRVCRLCLKTSDMYHPIFDSHQPEKSQTLSHKIMACAQVKVFEGDGLPTHVCNSCYSQIERSYQFKLLCEQSDVKLRGSIVNINGSSDSESIDGGDVDMTQLTPEVIIDEDPISATQHHEDRSTVSFESNGGVYNKIMQSVIRQSVTPGAADGSTTPSSSKTPRKPQYLNGLAGFVHSNQEMARVAVAMALHQRGVQEQQRKAQEKQRLVDIQIKEQQQKLRQQRAGDDDPDGTHGSPGKSRRSRGGEKAFKCHQCNKSYSFSSALSRHKAIHNTALRPHVCNICKKGFTQVEKLLRHQRTHTLDSVMTCDLCTRPFKSFATYHSHRLRGNCVNMQNPENMTNFVVQNVVPHHQRSGSGETVSYTTVEETKYTLDRQPDNDHQQVTPVKVKSEPEDDDEDSDVDFPQPMVEVKPEPADDAPQSQQHRGTVGRPQTDIKIEHHDVFESNAKKKASRLFI